MVDNICHTIFILSFTSNKATVNDIAMITFFIDKNFFKFITP